jgi:hypothetical protein
VLRYEAKPTSLATGYENARFADTTTAEMRPSVKLGGSTQANAIAGTIGFGWCKPTT